LNQSTQNQDEDMLRRELRQARERLEGLAGELCAVDQELEGLEIERRQFRLLQDVCGTLDELDNMGAGDLFWAGRTAGGDGGDHVRLVRGRIDSFEKRLDQIEERRQSIIDQIQTQEDSTDVIAGDVLEAEHFEQQRKLEWQIEREVGKIPIRASIMPWMHGGEDDRRFRKALSISLAVSLLLGIILQLVDLPIPEHWQVLEEQDRLTRLIREDLPPPPVAIEETKPKPREEPLPTEASEEPIVAQESTPQADPAPKPKSDTRSKGILAFRDKISGLTTNEAVDRLGSNARINDTGGGTAGLPQRSMVTSQVPGSSGGINIASLSRGTGGTGNSMGGVDITRATSTIGAGGGSDRPLSGGGPGLGRTDEEIQIVFDRHKAALYRMYNRELRKNPTLKGQMVLRMTIEADGSVSMCELKSTNMKSADLSSQVVERVKTFDFGAKDGISAITIAYPIDFLPAT
jgi:hypothetical protein